MKTDFEASKSPRSRAAKDRRVISVSRGSTTVKIYRVKNRGGELFMLTWFVGGKRHRQNFASEKAARLEAAALADRLNRGQAQTISLTGADRDAYVQSQAELAPLGLPLYAAVKDYVAAVRLLNGRPLLTAVKSFLHREQDQTTTKRVSEVYEEFLAQQKSNGRSIRYLQDIRSRLKRFAEAFKMDISDVRTTAIEEWLDDLEISARTRINFRTLLITFFKFARKRKYLPKNEPTAADELEAPTADDDEIEIYTRHELQQLITKSDEHTSR